MSCYLCSFCHHHCMGGCRCRCRSLRCSDSWRDHHSQTPAHTHPRLYMPTNKNIHRKVKVMICQLANPPKQDFYSACLCTQACWWISAPFAAVGAVHFGVPQQVKTSITLIDHGAASMEVRPLEEAVFQRTRRSAGHACKTHQAVRI